MGQQNKQMQSSNSGMQSIFHILENKKRGPLYNTAPPTTTETVVTGQQINITTSWTVTGWSKKNGFKQLKTKLPATRKVRVELLQLLTETTLSAAKTIIFSLKFSIRPAEH
jgi:hypothetical protein